MKITIGFIVVRKPLFVGELHGDAPKYIRRESGEEINYLGVDREPWGDFDDLFYMGRLDESHLSLRGGIVGGMNNFFSPGVLLDLSDARKVLRLSNSEINKSEILAVSNSFESLYGIDSYGADYYVDGFGSILRLGIFCKPDVFSDFIPYLNKNGLFDVEDDLIRYRDAYCTRARNGNLETFDDASLTLSGALWVGRPNV